MSSPPTTLRVQHLSAHDGVRLALHRLGDAGAPGALLVPGTFSNSSFWFGTRGTGFGRYLAEHGYEACSLDPRGHGRSARPGPGERWDFDDWGHDVATGIETLAADGRRIIAVGHSAGGAALLAALSAHPDLCGALQALVILATPGPWILRSRAVAARAALIASRVLPRFPARRLGLGPEDELPGVIAQWMRWNLGGHWRGDDGTDYTAGLAAVAVPALFIAGAGDHLWAPPSACRALYDQVGSPDKTFLVCGQRTAFSTDFDHVGLVVSRPARQEVWPIIGRWLGRTQGSGERER